MISIWNSLRIAIVAKIIVNKRRLRVMGIKRIPQGVKFSIRPTIGVRLMLKPMLRAMRSIWSMLWLFVLIWMFIGKMAFIIT